MVADNALDEAVPCRRMSAPNSASPKAMACSTEGKTTAYEPGDSVREDGGAVKSVRRHPSMTKEIRRSSGTTAVNESAAVDRSVLYRLVLVVAGFDCARARGRV